MIGNLASLGEWRGGRFPGVFNCWKISKVRGSSSPQHPPSSTENLTDCKCLLGSYSKRSVRRVRADRHHGRRSIDTCSKTFSRSEPSPYLPGSVCTKQARRYASSFSHPRSPLFMERSVFDVTGEQFSSVHAEHASRQKIRQLGQLSQSRRSSRSGRQKAHQWSALILFFVPLTSTPCFVCTGAPRKYAG